MAVEVFLLIYLVVAILMFVLGFVYVFLVYEYPRNQPERESRKMWARVLLASPVWPAAILCVILFEILRWIWNLSMIALGK